jgi:UDP-N-acetylmuramate dehydrogenase
MLSLAGWTTMRVGGPAKAFVRVADVASLAAALHEAGAAGDPLLVLGGGSNVVVADEGFPGTVVHIGMKGISLVADCGPDPRLSPAHDPWPDQDPSRAHGPADAVVAHVAAGEDWCDFVSYCVTEGLSGVECLSGIPGLAGATPVQNVGAYGQEVSQTIVSVTVWDRCRGSLLEMTPAECRFSYRHSLFKRNPRYVVTEVAFRLTRSRASGPLRYQELARYLGAELGQTPPLEETARAVLELRRAKGMVLDPADPDTRSVGSFFTNPVLDAPQLQALLELAPEVPMFPIDGSTGGEGTKVPAAWLVERAGFTRGYRKGGAAISSKHALALTVVEGGTAADVVALARAVGDGVRQRFGVHLEAEPVLVGVHL